MLAKIIYIDVLKTSFRKRDLLFRYVFAVLGSMGMAIIYGLKVNLSIALGRGHAVFSVLKLFELNYWEIAF